MKYVYLSVKVQNRIERLKKNGKAGYQLAGKVAGIIKSLTSGTVQHHKDAIDNYTKYGEHRIKNCRKYELGLGYRLIIVQRDSKTYIPFLGTHDECQRWLENHSRLKAAAFGKRTLFRVAPADVLSGDTETAVVDDTEEKGAGKWSSGLSDEDLRRVFRGLVAGMQKNR